MEGTECSATSRWGSDYLYFWSSPTKSERQIIVIFVGIEAVGNFVNCAMQGFYT